MFFKNQPLFALSPLFFRLFSSLKIILNTKKNTTIDIKPVKFVFIKAVRAFGELKWMQKIFIKPHNAFVNKDTNTQPIKYQSA